MRHNNMSKTEEAWLAGWLSGKNPLKGLWNSKQAPALWADVMGTKTLGELKRAVLESRLDRWVFVKGPHSIESNVWMCLD
jgi:hypothetical protein